MVEAVFVLLDYLNATPRTPGHRRLGWTLGLVEGDKALGRQLVIRADFFRHRSAIPPVGLETHEQFTRLELSASVALLLIEPVREHRQQLPRRPFHRRTLP